MSMWPASWISDDQHLAMLFTKWRGSRAEAWAYNVSHGQFLLRLHRLASHSLFIWCKSCQYVSFASHWSDSAVQVASSSGQVVLSDHEYLSVSCGAVFAAETDGYDIQFPAPGA